ncbi:hypothetical protein EDB19DRAFT_1694291, partial [Suillus lakei]
WPACRFLSTAYFNLPALDSWIASPGSLVLTDTFHSNHLSDFYVALPTRDGTRGRPYAPPVEGTSLGYGHHLAFFHPRNPEVSPRADGTDADFYPPEPFTRRINITLTKAKQTLYTMTWNKGGELNVGKKANAVSTVAKVEKKGFEVGKPMILVKQRIEVTVQGRNEPGMAEERAHVYQPSVATARSREPRQGESSTHSVAYLGAGTDGSKWTPQV